MMKVPEQYRIKTGELATNEHDGCNGAFRIPYGSDILQCIASDGMGWEHVSVTGVVRNRTRYFIPTWEIMCFTKATFWDKEDVVIQYHPAASQYVNNHPYVLHLWRPIGVELPIPQMLLVGIKL